MKVWQLCLYFACTAPLLCAGCVGGKLLDPSSAKLLDDNRQPKPYPIPSRERTRGASPTAKPPAVGTGVEATKDKLANASTTASSNNEPGEVTLATRHQHVGDQTNVLQIPPSRIGTVASAAHVSEVEPVAPVPVAPTFVQNEPPTGDLPPPAKTEPPSGPAIAGGLPPQLPVSNASPAQPAASLLESTAGPTSQAALFVEPPPGPAEVAERLPEAQVPRAEPASVEAANAEQTAAPKTAEELLPADPSDRLEWLQTRYVQALEQGARSAREGGNKEEASRLDQQLRLAYLLANDMEEAARGVESLPEAEREAYKQLMFGLAQFFSKEDARRPAHRNARVAKALRDAIRELTPASRLELKNLTFCERVEQYGWFTEFRRAEFAPKQQVLLYVEVENATAEKKGQDNFETELAGSYQIFDDAGKLAHERTLPLDKETCRNYRRDYFLAYRIYLPDDIAPGHYRLELTIEDLKARRTDQRKLGTAMIEFRLRS